MSENVTVMINIFSGLPNPQWTLPPQLAPSVLTKLAALPYVLDLKERAPSVVPQGKPSDPIGRPRSGYRGIEIYLESDKSAAPRFVIFGRLVLERDSVRVRTDIGGESTAQMIYATAPVEILQDIDGMTFAELTMPGEEGPIAGVEGPYVDLNCGVAPPYLGAGDPFNLHMQRNNCYNYATKVMNLSTQPGAVPDPNNHKKKFSVESLRAALLADQLTLKGMKQPTTCPPAGAHYVAALVRRHPTRRLRDIHFLRLDKSGRWSHKDGTGPVENEDNAGDPLTDLSQANLSWSPELAGFYLSFDVHRGMIN